jgi:hypothetical protein
LDLSVKERVEGVPARAEGIDLTHEPEYRKSGFSADKVRQSWSDARGRALTDTRSLRKGQCPLV